MKGHCFIFIVLLLLLSQTKVFPQVSERLSTPRAGDCLIGYRVLDASLTASGKNVVWSLSKVAFDKKHRKRWHNIYDNPDTLCFTESGTMHYLKPDNGKLIFDGCENNQEKVMYDIPIDYLLLPMNYGDSTSGVFHGTGAYCDKLKLRILGTYSLVADGTGSIVLPECNDTIYNILRVHLMRKAGMRTWSSDATLAPTRKYVPDSLENFISDSMNVIIYDEYRWYAQGYRYPIIEMSTVSFPGSNAQYGTAYYYPPSEQEEIAIDYENEAIRRSNNAMNSGHGEGNAPNDKQSFTYQFAKDQSSNTVTVKYVSDTMVDINAILSDISGIVMDTKKQSGQTNGEISFSYGCLRSGQYVVCIRVGAEFYVEKFTVE